MDLEFIEDMVGRDKNADIKKIDGEDYLVTYNTLQNIKGTELGWIIVEITPVSVIRTSVTEAGMRLFFIGLGCVVLGLVLIGWQRLFTTDILIEAIQKDILLHWREKDLLL